MSDPDPPPARNATAPPGRRARRRRRRRRDPEERVVTGGILMFLTTVWIGFAVATAPVGQLGEADVDGVGLVVRHALASIVLVGLGALVLGALATAALQARAAWRRHRRPTVVALVCIAAITAAAWGTLRLWSTAPVEPAADTETTRVGKTTIPFTLATVAAAPGHASSRTTNPCANAFPG